MGGALIWGDTAIGCGPAFTRGMAIADELMLIGGSHVAERAERQRADAWVYALNRADKSVTGSIQIQPLHEIRFVDRPDNSMGGVSSALAA